MAKVTKMSKVCLRCGTPNSDTARFCTDCAAPLEMACPNCGTVNRPEARFCNNCATPLRGPTPQTGMLPPNALLAGRYVILRKVGGGGMGAVYQAADQRIAGKLWAVKEMSDAALTTPLDKQQAVDAFRREAQLLATLDHGNLPKVSDFFTEGGKHYLVMDFIQGQTLEQMLLGALGFLPESEVVSWVVQLCDLLAYLHSRQPAIIFRDLKPANIMLNDEGRIKLIDFGIARVFQPGKGKDTQAMGTPGYAAPEQYGVRQSDARSDLYALGVTLHRLLTRHDPADFPFNLPPPRAINPALSPALAAVIARATQVDIAARFQTAAEMKTALTGQMPTPPAPIIAHAAPPSPKPPVAGPPSPIAGRQSEMVLTLAPGVTLEFVRVPAGEFLMGSSNADQDAFSDERPQHRVYLDEYLIGKCPVTNRQYRAFVQTTGQWAPIHWKNGQIPRGKEDHPTVHVSWSDAVAFCKWASQVTGRPVRLPTEAEWEKAARGPSTGSGDGRKYPWGDQAPTAKLLNYNRRVNDTTPVGSYPDGASPYGALDMAGNVREWVADLYHATYYASSPAQNPAGTFSGEGPRVVRGGSWNDDLLSVRAAARLRRVPVNRYENTGFRCTLSP